MKRPGTAWKTLIQAVFVGDRSWIAAMSCAKRWPLVDGHGRAWDRILTEPTACRVGSVTGRNQRTCLVWALQRHLPRVSLTLCVQAAMPIAPLASMGVGTIIGAAASGCALATVAKPGDCPGSEFGGEPSAAVGTFTMDPQLKLPSSVGGVKMGTV